MENKNILAPYLRWNNKQEKHIKERLKWSILYYQMFEEASHFCLLLHRIFIFFYILISCTITFLNIINNNFNANLEIINIIFFAIFIILRGFEEYLILKPLSDKYYSISKDYLNINNMISSEIFKYSFDRIPYHKFIDKIDYQIYKIKENSIIVPYIIKIRYKKKIRNIENIYFFGIGFSNYNINKNNKFFNDECQVKYVNKINYINKDIETQTQTQTLSSSNSDNSDKSYQSSNLENSNDKI